MFGGASIHRRSGVAAQLDAFLHRLVPCSLICTGAALAATSLPRSKLSTTCSKFCVQPIRPRQVPYHEPACWREN